MRRDSCRNDLGFQTWLLRQLSFITIVPFGILQLGQNRIRQRSGLHLTTAQ